MRQKQRERIAEILSNSYPCNHCQKLFDETELFPMAMTFRRTHPPSIIRHKLDGYSKGYYLFCRECIPQHGGTPNINMRGVKLRDR